jgi:hypothetical protein
LVGLFVGLSVGWFVRGFRGDGDDGGADEVVGGCVSGLEDGDDGAGLGAGLGVLGVDGLSGFMVAGVEGDAGLVDAGDAESFEYVECLVADGLDAGEDRPRVGVGVGESAFEVVEDGQPFGGDAGAFGGRRVGVRSVCGCFPVRLEPVASGRVVR